MTTMLERAARALALLQGAEWDARSAMETPGGERPDEMRSGFLDQARAVLMAVREPDGDMLGAGDKVFNHGCHGSTWTAMIDAILADGEGR